MGRSCACKFLFGAETISEEKEKIELALENKIELKTELYFYKKDGGKFKCLLDIVPIKNEKSKVVLILVSHKDIGGKVKSEDNEEEKSISDHESDEEVAEAYRRCQSRRSLEGALPGTDGYNSQRRRSRAVLYHLSGQFEKHKRANRAKTKLQQLNKFSSISGKMPEYKIQEIKKSKFILVHYGIFKIGWDWLILLCTFYTAILVPYNAAFTQKKNQRESIYSDVVVEILFMIDILFNFRTSYVNKSGQAVYEARLIAINYIKGWFLLDLLAAIPFDFLYIFNVNAVDNIISLSLSFMFSASKTYPHFRWYFSFLSKIKITFMDAPVHLLKVARLIRLARLLQKIDRFSQYSALVLALLMSMFTLLAHWLACIWYAIGNMEFEEHTSAGWLSELSDRLELNPQNQTSNETVKPDMLISYLSALYFCCSSLTSVGFGNVSANTNSEKIFSVCAMIVGALAHAVVFGNVTALIQRMYQRRANFHSKTKDLKDFFRAYDVPKPLKQRMQEYFQTMWSMNNGIETNEILKDFPEEMKGEIGLHLHKEILNLPIFEEATQGCLKSIALHTKRSFCAPGEFLVHKGDASNYMFLLVSGSMEILKADMVVAILGKGDLFGSDIDFGDPISVCNYDVRSLTYSELQCISIKGLTDVLVLYPDFAEKFAKDIHNDLTYNLRQCVDDSDEETAGTPKTRICTLPSISEDEEDLSSTDDDEHNSKSPDKVTEGYESDVQGLTYDSLSSSLIPTTRTHPKLPNGDIPAEPLSSPPPVSHWGVRRHSGLAGRSSMKEARKMHIIGSHSDGVEKIIPHFQNLQNEIEGAKAAIGKLERKISKMGQDICAIDRNMRELLKHITNVSKMSPLEPLAPATPNTPLAGNQQFLFEISESGLHASQQNLRTDNKKEFDKILNNSNSTLTQEIGSSKTDINNAFLAKTNNVKEQLNVSMDNCRKKSRRGSTPMLLNPHELVTRRHSDGSNNKQDGKSNAIGTPVFKSYYDVSESLYADCRRACNEMRIESEFKETDKLIDDNSDNESIISETFQTYSVDHQIKTSDKIDQFKDKLEECHSNDCYTLDKLPKRNLSLECLADKKTNCNKRCVRKSRTCNNFAHIPVLTVNDDSTAVQFTNLETESGSLEKNVKPSEQRPIQVLSSNQRRKKQLFKNDKMKKCSPTPIQYDLLETEFGASEIMTVHVTVKPDSIPYKVNYFSSIPISELETELFVKENDFEANMRPSRNMKLALKDVVVNNDETSPSEDEQSLEILQSDSEKGNLKEIEKCALLVYNKDTNKIVDSSQTHYDTTNLAKQNDCVSVSKYIKPKEEIRIYNIDISPDSFTDISGSLKTEDETVVDIELDTAIINEMFRHNIDSNNIRTTDL